MERCKEYLVTEPETRKGAWRTPGRSLNLEIGCGKGSFTCALAAAEPEQDLVAIEKVPDAMILAMERAQAAGLRNVCFLDYDAAKLRELHRLSGGNIRVACVAPEADGAVEFIREAAEFCRVSAAHTAADYSAGIRAVNAGISNATHLYNAMNDVTRREPGCAAALLESGCFCEVICDGIHLHPAVIRLTHRIVGAERLCIVSDGMAATGLGNGTFSLGTQTVTVNGSEARLENGSLAGSVTDIRSAFFKAVEFGIPPLDALRAVTLNPARALGIDSYLGTIEAGKSARLTRLNPDIFRNV